MSHDVASIRAGDVLGGRYRVERVLGRGAVALVLAITDLTDQRPYALKLLDRAARSLPSTVERFFREARAMARLTSEHAVRVFDVGTFDDGAPYLVMEHLEGTDLGAMVKRRGAIPAHEAALYLVQACEAIGEAHANGIVHRDLKPGNLFLTQRRDGAPCLKVLDFGFSKQLTLSERERQVTLNNAVLGSPAYMSPEQVLSPRDVGARTDIWSLGVVLYQLVTGQLPFRGADAAATLAEVMRNAPAPPSSLRAGLPLAIDDVVMRCLNKDASDRYDAAGLSAALAPFIPGYQPPSAAVGAPASRFRVAIALLILFALAGVVTIVVALLRG